MKDFFKKALPYIICALIGTAIFITIICVKKIWDAGETRDVMAILCDACFVPGVVLGGLGLLVFASNGGAFDMLAYAFIKFFDLFRKDCRNKKYKDFYEYRQAKKDRKHGMAFMLITGIVFIVFASIFLIAYYRV